ncbi:MAG: hypothetical protein QXF14_04495, partial [Candidatus Woesearchaeota archaeon]
MGEELLMKKVVSNLVDQTNIVKQSETTSNADNFKKILPTLLEKGLDNINLSMFNEVTRRHVLNVLG